MTRSPVRVMTREEWEAEGVRRFGPEKLDWKFICPSCGHIASVKDWVDAGGQGGIGFSCIGRWIGSKRNALDGKGPGPCNYAGAGLFRLGPVKIEGDPAHWFDFAPEEFEDPNPDGEVGGA